MRYLVGFISVLALGVMPVVGCGETAGTGGRDGGVGGDGGMGGDGGTGGTDLCEGVDCDDGNDCTEDICSSADGSCMNEARSDGSFCAEGYCQSGDCEPIESVFPCTEQGLRDAIAAGGGPHGFSCDGPTTVATAAEVLIDQDVVLDGRSQLTVDGGTTHRVFEVGSGPDDGLIVELRRMEITRGSAPGTLGGGIFNWGALTLDSVTVRDNDADAGCGVANFNGPLTVTNSTVSDNGAGTAISSALGPVTLIRSTVSSNGGVGVATLGGMVTISESAISGNAGTGVRSLVVNATNSTISRNSGQGISTSDLTLVNSTVSGNAGGGITSARGGPVLRLVASTIAQASMGSAIYVGGSQTFPPAPRKHVEMVATIVRGVCTEKDHGDAIWTSLGYNIESPGDTCGFDPDGTDQVDVTEGQLNLGPLQDNRGPTMTHALLPGSVAIDVIPADMCEVDEDQRGVARPQGGACDVGAVEMEVAP